VGNSSPDFVPPVSCAHASLCHSYVTSLYRLVLIVLYEALEGDIDFFILLFFLIIIIVYIYIYIYIYIHIYVYIS